MDSFVAKANVGAGTDQIAGKSTASGFVGSVLLTDKNGAEIDTANPVPVAIQGSTPVEGTFWQDTQPVSATALPLPAGAATEATLDALSALLQEVCIRLADVADSVGNLTPDAAGRLRVTAEVVASHAVTLASLATVTTLTNMAQVGGYAANQQIIAQTQMNEFCLRQNVVIS